MGDIELKASMKENGITERTPIILPLRLQIALWVAIIIVTSGTVGSYLSATNAINKIADGQNEANKKIDNLNLTKVDKITYENDRKNDIGDREDIKRWMGLIMDKLEVIDYGQQPKTKRIPANNNREKELEKELEKANKDKEFYKNQYEDSKKEFNKGMGVEK